MIAVTTRKTQPEIVEQVMHEHDALRDKVRQIHTVLAEPAPANAEIDTLLREFLHALVVHFTNGEN